jgi:hypothetical protein
MVHKHGFRLINNAERKEQSAAVTGEGTEGGGGQGG